MATQAAIKTALETLAANMKAAELTDSQWADQMATVIFNAITGRSALADAGGPTPMLDSVSGAVTGTATIT